MKKLLFKMGGLVLFFSLLEIAISYLLTGYFSPSVEHKAFLSATLLLSITTALLFTPRKILSTFLIPLLVSISPLFIKVWNEESVSQIDTLQTIGFAAGIYCLILLLGTFISYRKIKTIYYLVFITLFILPAAGFWFYYGMTGNFIHPDTLMAIYQTNSAEATSYLKEYLSISSLLFVVIAIALMFVIRHASTYLPTFSLSSLKNKYCILLFLVILLTANNLIRKTKDNIYWVTYTGTVEYLQQYAAFANNQKNRKHNKLPITLTTMENGVYFLILGESQNKMHMSCLWIC